MKVWEKCAELKAPNATEQDVYRWAAMNRICPLDFHCNLELDENKEEIKKDSIKLYSLASVHCESNVCGPDCYRSFINLEFE